MQVFLWRHNRRFHSWSMINEPVIHQGCYTDAVVIVQAATEEDAYRLLAAEHPEWVVEELRRLKPRVFAGDAPAVVFAAISGD